MICIIKHGANFSGILAYALAAKKSAELVYTTTLGEDAKSITRELDGHSDRSERCKKRVAHYILSAADGEVLSPQDWVESVEAVMRSCEAHHAAAIRHHDTGHDHIHIVMSRVRNDGKAWSTSHERLRMRKVCQELEERFGLRRTPSRSGQPKISQSAIERAARRYREGVAASPIPESLQREAAARLKQRGPTGAHRGGATHPLRPTRLNDFHDPQNHER